MTECLLGRGVAAPFAELGDRAAGFVISLLLQRQVFRGASRIAFLSLPFLLPAWLSCLQDTHSGGVLLT